MTFDTKYTGLLFVLFLNRKKYYSQKHFLTIATIGKPTYKRCQILNSDSISIVIQVSISCSKIWNVRNK